MGNEFAALSHLVHIIEATAPSTPWIDSTFYAVRNKTRPRWFGSWDDYIFPPEGPGNVLVVTCPACNARIGSDGIRTDRLYPPYFFEARDDDFLSGLAGNDDPASLDARQPVACCVECRSEAYPEAIGRLWPSAVRYDLAMSSPRADCKPVKDGGVHPDAACADDNPPSTRTARRNAMRKAEIAASIVEDRMRRNRGAERPPGTQLQLPPEPAYDDDQPGTKAQRDARLKTEIDWYNKTGRVMFWASVSQLERRRQKANKHKRLAGEFTVAGYLSEPPKATREQMAEFRELVKEMRLPQERINIWLSYVGADSVAEVPRAILGEYLESLKDELFARSVEPERALADPAEISPDGPGSRQDAAVTQPEQARPARRCEMCGRPRKPALRFCEACSCKMRHAVRQWQRHGRAACPMPVK